MSDPCELLPWDSEFFGLRIARVKAQTLDAAAALAVSTWLDDHDVDCAYFLAHGSDPETLKAASHAGFDLVDVRVELRTDSPAAIPTPHATDDSRVALRAACPGDLAALMDVARVSHRDSRFYCDGRFDPARCDELFATWIERSCRGYADHSLVAVADGRVAGYITAHLDGPNGRIGLVGVHPERRGRGIGRALLTAALAWFGERGAAAATVVTQGRNADALQFYQRHGFHVADLSLWYHRWSPRR